MIELAEIKPGHVVLEPSAGEGALAILAASAAAPDGRVVAYEIREVPNWWDTHREAGRTIDVSTGVDFLNLDVLPAPKTTRLPQSES